MKFTVHKGHLIPASPETLEYVAKLDSGVVLDLDQIKAKQRTGRQNNSLHLYCSMVSKALNDAGLDMVEVLEQGTDIPWDAEGKMVKKYIWKKVQSAMLDKESTTELTTAECSPIYDVVNRHLSTTFGVSVLWPSYLDLENK